VYALSTGIFLSFPIPFTATFRKVLGITRLPIQQLGEILSRCVNWPEHEAGYFSSSVRDLELYLFSAVQSRPARIQTETAQSVQLLVTG
jgi:hypothetical protein